MAWALQRAALAAVVSLVSSQAEIRPSVLLLLADDLGELRRMSRYLARGTMHVSVSLKFMATAGQAARSAELPRGSKCAPAGDEVRGDTHMWTVAVEGTLDQRFHSKSTKCLKVPRGSTSITCTHPLHAISPPRCPVAWNR